MRKQALALFFVMVIFVGIAAEPVGAWSLKDLLKGTISKALDLFKRQVMPIDGYEAIEVGKSFIIEGAHWWNPDYYVYLDEAKVRFSWWIPREVTVKASVYKVYFGIIALYQGQTDDIWWDKAEIGKDAWIGAFWISGFDWKRSGWSNATKAYIAYNLPAAEDMSKNYNVTILQNGSIKLEFPNETKILTIEEFEGFGNITVVNVTYKHLIGSLYLVRKAKGGDEG